MNKLKKPIIFFIILTIAWFAFGYYLKNIKSKQGNKITQISLDRSIFHVEVVSSQEKREQGLSFRKEICSSCGMLFEFEKPGKYSFWMKDTLIPLDILWISQGKIVHIEKSVQPDFKGTLKPSEDADFVLEVNAGKVDELGIAKGDQVIF